MAHKNKFVCKVTLDDGSVVVVDGENLGYSKTKGCYVTKFKMGGNIAFSNVPMLRHKDFQCPAPELRLNADTAFLEKEILKQYGLAVVDIDA